MRRQKTPTFTHTFEIKAYFISILQFLHQTFSTWCIFQDANYQPINHLDHIASYHLIHEHLMAHKHINTKYVHGKATGCL